MTDAHKENASLYYCLICLLLYAIVNLQHTIKVYSFIRIGFGRLGIWTGTNLFRLGGSAKSYDHDCALGHKDDLKSLYTVLGCLAAYKIVSCGVVNSVCQVALNGGTVVGISPPLHLRYLLEATVRSDGD